MENKKNYYEKEIKRLKLFLFFDLLLLLYSVLVFCKK